MPVISYTASRELVGSAGAQQIETNFQDFPRRQIFKGEKEETLDGTPEGWLDALQHEYDITSDIILESAVPRWREFFASVAAGEVFQIDFTGTIASPGTDVDVWIIDDSVQEQYIAVRNAQYRFRVKVAP